MRTRLVIWGNNTEDQRVLIAVSLNAEDNKVEIWSIPETDISETFYNVMMSQWRDGQDIALPATTKYEINELTMAESILPDHLKVERSDVIHRAQMEWHFVVLSTKLYKNFKTELEEITDKIKRLEVYDSKLWDELKGIWESVQKHILDKNLFRDHSDSLKERANALFEDLKKLRSAFTSEITQKSKEAAKVILEKLQTIEQKIQSGAVLKPLFDDLKLIQEEFRKLNLSHRDREILMAKVNDGFKLIRDKREQHHSHQQDNGNTSDRLGKRFEGLLSVIQKMESSIAFEKKNIDYENRRIATTSGQLEAQIRAAKIKMIEERIRSKQEKLDELLKTKEKLEVVTENLKRREEKMAEKKVKYEKIKQETEKVKAKITEEIHQAQDKLSTDEQEKLAKAAEEIVASKKPRKKKDTTPTISASKENTEPKIIVPEENQEENPEEKVSEEE